MGLNCEELYVPRRWGKSRKERKAGSRGASSSLTKAPLGLGRWWMEEDRDKETEVTGVMVPGLSCHHLVI